MMFVVRRFGVCVLGFMLAASTATAAEVVHLRLADTIQPAAEAYIARGLEQAAEVGAELVVLELDTPGGLLTTTRLITTDITSSPVPVAVLVAPAGAQAASAGFFILLSADVAAMAPGTNTGAASPVSGGGEEIGETMKAKVFNDAAAMIRSLAEGRGRNVEAAVEAVTEATSFSADEALEKNLVDLVVGGVDELVEALDRTEVTRFDGSATTLDLSEPVLVRVERTFTERLFSLLANPNIAYLLMALGALGLYVEITHPGGILPGAVGAVFLLLALYSMSILPVNWAGIALIFVALVLFLLEVKVVSYGLLTIGGLISFVLGSLMLFEGPIPALRVHLGVILPTALLLTALAAFLLSRVLRLHRTRPVTGREGLVGEAGKAITDLEPLGKVLVHGEYWDARSAESDIPAGSVVRVVQVGERRIDVVADSG